MSEICFMAGIGFQELLLIGIFLVFIIGIPVVLLVLIVKLVRRRSSVTVNHTSGNQPSSILQHADKLRELKSLQDKGIISTDEFEIEKKKILEG